MTPQEAREILDRPLCWCGRHKLPGQSLCRKCWMLLDDELRAELREKIGSGFEQSYDMVVAMLKRHVRFKHAVPVLESKRAAWR